MWKLQNPSHQNKEINLLLVASDSDDEHASVCSSLDLYRAEPVISMDSCPLERCSQHEGTCEFYHIWQVNITRLQQFHVNTCSYFQVKTSGVSGSPSSRNWVFFIDLLQCTESSMLLLMAFDRFVAIRDPLRYASILTPQRITRMGLVCMLKGVALIFPLPFLLKRFQYCRTNVLSHSYCLHQEVMKMACSDITVNSIYGLSVALLTVGLDSLLIFLSYVMILKTVLSVASPMECLRALNTCVSHLCAVLLFYTPIIGLSVIHRFGKGPSPLLQILLGYIYLLVPPLMNPIVYSMKSKHLRATIIRVFTK
ncbi:Olfactory receptor 51G2 [Chelonia mydas]|uniref:Olfactory receptor 51G2 n=1 Tax=Chelonia mydas TaxID=8469 RepID=M7AJD2_CHEMY|nr:Olfactory receptor 51G2 [Chelonia mydas]